MLKLKFNELEPIYLLRYAERYIESEIEWVADIVTHDGVNEFSLSSTENIFFKNKLNTLKKELADVKRNICKLVKDGQLTKEEDGRFTKKVEITYVYTQRTGIKEIDDE